MNNLEQSRKVNRDIDMALTLIRQGDLPEELRLRISNYIEKAKIELRESYGMRFAASFHKNILWNLQNDKRVKNYLWYYCRRKSREVPLEKELQVLEAIEDKLKLKKFAKQNNGVKEK